MVHSSLNTKWYVVVQRLEVVRTSSGMKWYVEVRQHEVVYSTQVDYSVAVPEVLYTSS